MRFTLAKTAKENSLGCWPGIPEQDLLEAADKAAIYSTHPLATHRFEHILFRIEDRVIVAAFNERQVARLALETVCPDCENDGGYCETCNSTGTLKQSVGQIAAQMKEQKIMEDRRRVQKFTGNKGQRRVQGAERVSAGTLR